MLDVLFGGLEASPLQRHSWRTQEKYKLLNFLNLCHKKDTEYGYNESVSEYLLIKVMKD
jgi:hypothetical protein